MGYNSTCSDFAELCKGSTTDSDSVCLGSNPSSAANEKRQANACLFSLIYTLRGTNRPWWRNSPLHPARTGRRRAVPHRFVFLRLIEPTPLYLFVIGSAPLSTRRRKLAKRHNSAGFRRVLYGDRMYFRSVGHRLPGRPPVGGLLLCPRAFFEEQKESGIIDKAPGENAAGSGCFVET